MIWEKGMKIFAERLKSLRLEEGLSLRELSDVVKINKDILSRCERGVRQPNGDELVRLATFFKVTTDYLLGLED